MDGGFNFRNKNIIFEKKIKKSSKKFFLKNYCIFGKNTLYFSC